MAVRTYKVSDVARFFLASAEPDDNDISNLKLKSSATTRRGF